MRLFLVRHAKAAPGEPDELRPLTSGGRKAARELGERLKAEQPQTVVSSPLLRARETAEAIAHAAGVEPETDERLAPGANADSVRTVVDGRAGPVVIVGHQPDCSEIVFALTGRVEEFAPGGVHMVEL
jgi:phosphohistidine phosphatase